MKKFTPMVRVSQTYGRPLTVPRRLLAERDERWRQEMFHGERSITAEIMGDPAPGRSALDKRKPA